MHGNNDKVVAVVGISLLAVSNMATAFEYFVTSMGTIGVSTSSRAYGINQSGQAVRGIREGDQYVGAFIWDQSGGIRALASLGGKTRAWDINNAGQIAGESGDHPVMWETETTNPLDLGTLGGNTGTAFRIHDSGRIVGWADTSVEYGLSHAFLYEGGNMTDLGTLNTAAPEWNYGYSLAYDVDSAGRVVGVASTNDWSFHAFLSDGTNGMTDLGTHPDHPGSEGYASVINEKGTIAGHGYDAAVGGSYPMLWNDASGNWVLLTMLPGYPYGEFYDLNESDQMVGVMWNDEEEEHASIYDPANGVRDLNDLIPPDAGWLLTDASGINEQGQIVGYGMYEGAERAFLLSPVPLPPSIVLLGSALLGLVLTRLGRYQAGEDDGGGGGGAYRSAVTD